MAEKPVVVVAIFRAADGKLDQLRQALVESIPAVHAEDGCELYAIHDAPDDHIYMLEKWTRRAALDAHSAGEPVRQLGERVNGLTAAPTEVIVMDPIAAGTPAQGLL
jgi:quinol monooxygenase YgiN